MALSLLCDEHIPYPVTEGLKRRGIDVRTVQETGLRSEEDKAILERAYSEGWVVYTRDADFLRLHSAGIQHAGILYHRPLAYSVGECIRRLVIACQVLSVEEMRGSVKFI